MRVLFRAWVITGLAAVLALLPSVASAQATASIAGAVTDASGAVLPGVTVEAASPALIEKVRTVVTDGSGQYRLEQLRGGVYTVTFTLPGFNTVKREGLELGGSFVATVNAEMRVGAVEETVTVTGESPIVDIQSANRQRVINQELLEAIPTGRTPQVAAFMIPGVNLNNVDVGGTNIINTTGGSMSIHGGAVGDTRILIDGITTANAEGTGWAANMLPNMGSTQEVSVDYSSASAESITGGLQINMIPKTGGNRYAGLALRHRRQLLVPGLQQHRRASRPRPAHAQQPEASVRHQPGAGRPDPGRQAVVLHLGPVHAAGQLHRRPVPEQERLRHHQVGLRAGREQPGLLRLHRGKREPAPDLAGQSGQQVQRLLRQRTGAANVRSPPPPSRRRPPIISSTRSRTCSPCPIRPRCRATSLWRPAPASGARSSRTRRTTPEDPNRLLIPVIEQGGLIPGLLYRGRGLANATQPYQRTLGSVIPWSASMSYVTGSHSAKFGVYNVTAIRESTVPDNFAKLTYRFNNGVPNQLTQRTTPLDRTERQRYRPGSSTRRTSGRSTA